MKNMQSLYFAMPTQQLKVLRSKKIVALQKIQSYPESWFGRRDDTKLRTQIFWIDAVLRCRANQLPLF